MEQRKTQEKKERWGKVIDITRRKIKWPEDNERRTADESMSRIQSGRERNWGVTEFSGISMGNGMLTTTKG